MFFTYFWTYKHIYIISYRYYISKVDGQYVIIHIYNNNRRKYVISTCTVNIMQQKIISEIFPRQ